MSDLIMQNKQLASMLQIDSYKFHLHQQCRQGLELSMRWELSSTGSHCIRSPLDAVCVAMTAALCDRLSWCCTRVDSGLVYYFLIIQQQQRTCYMKFYFSAHFYVRINIQQYYTSAKTVSLQLSGLFCHLLGSSSSLLSRDKQLQTKEIMATYKQIYLWHLHEHTVKYHYSVKTVKLAVTVIKFAVGAHLMFMLIVNFSLG